jgi:LPS-assembly protein
MKYYVDLNKESNKDTIQQLPAIHYHKYLQTAFDDYILYNLNVKSTNLYRKEGTTAIQTNADIPIELRTTLFDEYLNLAYKTDIFAQYTHFQNDLTYTKTPFNDGYYARNYNMLSASTQLSKKYTNFIHTVSFSTSYIKSGFEKKSGFYKDYDYIDCQDPRYEKECGFYKVSDIQEALSMNFIQYLYDSQGKEILYHRLSDIIKDASKSTKTIGELESELNYKITKYLTFYNDMLFNFSYHTFFV